jgi:hypothetical protein
MDPSRNGKRGLDFQLAFFHGLLGKKLGALQFATVMDLNQPLPLVLKLFDILHSLCCRYPSVQALKCLLKWTESAVQLKDPTHGRPDYAFVLNQQFSLVYQVVSMNWDNQMKGATELLISTLVAMFEVLRKEENSLYWDLVQMFGNNRMKDEYWRSKNVLQTMTAVLHVTPDDDVSNSRPRFFSSFPSSRELIVRGSLVTGSFRHNP